MLLPSPDLRIWLYAKPVDMRKQFDGLIVLAKHQLHASPMSGELFVFINRKQTMMKVLYFSRGGYCLWSKRLELGRFHHVEGDGDKINLTWTQLQCLIEGINWQKQVKNKRFSSL